MNRIVIKTYAALAIVFPAFLLGACGKSAADVERENATQREKWQADAAKVAAQQAAAINAGASRILAERKAAEEAQRASEDAERQASLISEGENKLRERSFDPKAVEFRNVIAGANYVCGELNGKNRFGAYTGFKAFVVNDRGAYVDGSTDNLEQTLFEMSAKEAGCKITTQ